MAKSLRMLLVCLASSVTAQQKRQRLYYVGNITMSIIKLKAPTKAGKRGCLVLMRQPLLKILRSDY